MPWWKTFFDAEEFERKKGRKPITPMDIGAHNARLKFLDMEKIVSGDIAGETCNSCGKEFESPWEVIIGKWRWGIEDPPAFFFLLHEECKYEDFLDGSFPDWEETWFFDIPSPKPPEPRTRFRTLAITQTLEYRNADVSEGVQERIIVSLNFDEQGAITYARPGKTASKSVDKESLDDFERDLLKYLGWT